MTRELLGEFGDFVRKLAEAEHKSKLVESFLAEHPTRPILEGNLVHFVYHGEVEDLAISGNFIRGRGQREMHRVEGTDFYFRSYELPQKALFSYRFWVFDEPMTDPANPQKTGPDGRERSVLATAGWQAPSHLREPDGQRGRIEKLQWKSEQLDNEREVQVYLPPGYEEGEARYPLLLVNDGDNALSQGEMDKSLDNLTGESIAPAIVAFVPVVSWRELNGSETADYARAQGRGTDPSARQQLPHRRPSRVPSGSGSWRRWVRGHVRRAASPGYCFRGRSPIVRTRRSQRGSDGRGLGSEARSPTGVPLELVRHLRPVLRLRRAQRLQEPGRERSRRTATARRCSRATTASAGACGRAGSPRSSRPCFRSGSA